MGVDVSFYIEKKHENQELPETYQELAGHEQTEQNIT
jgi:hypothetical protein